MKICFPSISRPSQNQTVAAGALLLAAIGAFAWYRLQKGAVSQPLNGRLTMLPFDQQPLILGAMHPPLGVKAVTDPALVEQMAHFNQMWEQLSPVQQALMSEAGTLTHAALQLDCLCELKSGVSLESLLQAGDATQGYISIFDTPQQAALLLARHSKAEITQFLSQYDLSALTELRDKAYDLVDQIEMPEELAWADDVWLRIYYDSSELPLVPGNPLLEFPPALSLDSMVSHVTANPNWIDRVRNLPASPLSGKAPQSPDWTEFDRVWSRLSVDEQRAAQLILTHEYREKELDLLRTLKDACVARGWDAQALQQVLTELQEVHATRGYTALLDTLILKYPEIALGDVQSTLLPLFVSRRSAAELATFVSEHSWRQLLGLWCRATEDIPLTLPPSVLDVRIALEKCHDLPLVSGNPLLRVPPLYSLS